MKLKDCVGTINFGYNLSTKEVNESCSKNYEYNMLSISSINSGFIYKGELRDYISDNELNPKFLTKIGDIVICCKQPYNMALIKKHDDENILVNSNFIVLRDIKINKDFLYNYLLFNRRKIVEEKRKQLENNNKVNENLSKPDLETIDITIPKSLDIEKISKVLEKINKRQSLYDDLINNDRELIKTLLEKEGVIDND